MRIYRGHRGEGGKAHVRVADVEKDAQLRFQGLEPNEGWQPLELHLNIVNHSPDGFEWGYTGSGPAQLAAALCCDVLVDAAAFNQDAVMSANLRARHVHQRVKELLVAKWKGDTWELRGDELIALIVKVERRG